MAGEIDANPAAQSPAAKKARTRSRAYPYLDLRAALDKAGALWRAEGRHAVAVSLAMQHWGYKAESSTGYSCIAALKKFGLVDEDGIGDSRQVRLSRLALAVLLDDDRASPERNAALQTAALSPRIHAELWEKYGADLPSDSSLRRFLILEKNFNEASVAEFLEEYKTTVAFAGLRSDDDAPPVPGNPPAASSPAPASGRRTEPASQRHGRPALPLASAAPSKAGRPDVAIPPAVTGRKSSPAPITAAVPQKNLAAKPPPAAPEPETGFLFPEVNDCKETSPTAAATKKFRPDDDDATPASEPAQRELSVPLDNDSVVRVPYPMSEEDFDLLIETLHLWKRRLVRQLD